MLSECKLNNLLNENKDMSCPKRDLRPRMMEGHSEAAPGALLLLRSESCSWSSRLALLSRTLFTCLMMMASCRVCNLINHLGFCKVLGETKELIYILHDLQVFDEVSSFVGSLPREDTVLSVCPGREGAPCSLRADTSTLVQGRAVSADVSGV